MPWLLSARRLSRECHHLRYAELREKHPLFSPGLLPASTATQSSTPGRTRKEIVCGTRETRSSISIAMSRTMMIINGREWINWGMIPIMQMVICGLVARMRSAMGCKETRHTTSKRMQEKAEEDMC
jgi:hypothetical protein